MFARCVRLLPLLLCCAFACTQSTNRTPAPEAFGQQDQAVSATASYDSTFHVPRCATPASSCDSGMLLIGRDTLLTTGEQETNQPNTLDGCADLTDDLGGAQPASHYVSSINVASTSGQNIQPGATVSVRVVADCLSTSDYIDVYYAASAHSPSWTPVPNATSIICNVPADGSTRSYTFTTNLTLANTTGDHAVRAMVRHLGMACPCASTTGCTDTAQFTADTDDLVFSVGGGVGFTPGPNLTVARAGQTATLLSGGDVLFAGGGTANSETYGLGSQAFTGTMPLFGARSAHTATRLPNQQVLVAGGSDGTSTLGSTALYNPATLSYSAGPNLNSARESHTATLLGNGTVLLVGGVQNFSTYLKSAEIYDPAKNQVNAISTGLTTGRNFHTANLLPSGKVLVGGGFDGTHSLASLELYDPSSNGFTALTSPSVLQTARRGHTATVLQDGTVLFVGGRSDSSLLSSCEIYNPTTGQVTATGSLAAPRYLHSATLMPNGTVLVVGGYSTSGAITSAELFTPSTGQWKSAGSLMTARYQHTATLLPNDEVLIAGGTDANGTALTSTEVNYWSGTPSTSAQPSITTFSATVAPGQTLTVGGSRFRGLSESSSGNTQSSPSDVPLMLLTGAGGSFYLDVHNDSATSASADLPCSTPLGAYKLSIIANGVSSTPVAITVGGLQQGASCVCSEACQGAPPSAQCYSNAGSCQQGQCYYPPAPQGGSCDDGSACTMSDQCDGHGGCAGISYSCKPNQCQTASTCDGFGGCTTQNRTQGSSCDDGNGCTTNDVCDGTGTCGGTAQSCGTPPPATCVGPNTSRVYNATAACSAATGMCNFTYNDVSCGANTCNQATGLCNGSTNTCAGITCNKPPNTQCFAPTGTCTSGSCQYTQMAIGTRCDDGNPCTTNDACDASGECLGKFSPAGTSCDDGNSCTLADRCDGAGSCAGTPLVCNNPPDLQCNSSAGSCVNGACVYTPKPNGTACDDHTACTPTSTCQSGVCVGQNAVVCPAPDQCHDQGACDPGTGACSNPPKKNGTGCDDGNGCTQKDSCQSGQCVPGNPVVCLAMDSCHDAGTCNPSSGLCSNPTKQNGTACDDGSACTSPDTCNAGVCVGANPVTCPPPDQCHTAGSCDPFSGQCTYQNKPDFSPCNDGNACTTGETCQSGICVSGSPVTCAPLDSCHAAGVCDPSTGQCSTPVKLDGSACDDNNKCTLNDSCQSGVCVGANPVECPASDQCHEAGICNPASGVCTNPAKQEGTPCEDGDKCTENDACHNGACVTGTPVVCKALDSCHVAGVCETDTGTCTNPAKPENAGCDDNNKCTQNDICQTGVCKGTPAVECPPPGECQVAGVCQADSGKCSYAAAMDGTSCTGGKCKGGVCLLDPALQRQAGGGCHCGSSGQPTAMLMLLLAFVLRRRFRMGAP